MIYLAYALMYLGGIAGTVYLVITGHPWFAFFVLLCTAAISMKSESGNDKAG